MKKQQVLLISAIIALMAFVGCAGSGGNAVAPDTEGQELASMSRAAASNTYLWGYYDVYFDPETKEIKAVPNREAMFAANVVAFLNGKPASLQFNLVSTTVGSGYIDVDINVGITHPFPGLPQYNGYDVRGIFIGDNSDQLEYGSNLGYAVRGVDQCLTNADGYTRWFNPGEFIYPGLMGYTPGDFATRGYKGSATLNPYKYYADGMAGTSDVWDFLTSTSGNGVFSSGRTNTRKYIIRFPNATGVRYNYSIVANWVNESTHPANAPEAVGCNIAVDPDLWYKNDAEWGGSLILDLTVFNWDSQPDQIFIEADFIGGLYELSAGEMIPTSTSAHTATYHVEIPATNLENTEGNEFWIICQYDDYDYKCEYTPPGPSAAPNASLAAFFRFGVYVAPEQYCQSWVPVVETLNGKSANYIKPNSFTGWTVEGDLFEDGDVDVAVNDGVNDVAEGTNVQWIDKNNLSFDIDLSDVEVGTYDIVVTNGCGDRKKGTGEDLLVVLNPINVYGTPNLSIGTGTGKDIACRPSGTYIGITMQGSNEWRRFSSDYGSYVTFNTWGNYEAGYWDATDSYLFLGADENGTGIYPVWAWTDWSGGNNYANWYSVYVKGIKDIANCQGSADDYCYSVYDYETIPRAYFIYTWQSWTYRDDYYTSYPWYNGEYSGGVVLDNIRGMDLSYPVFDYYILEALPDSDTGIVERWDMAPMPPTYKGAFGEDFFYDPLDITVDSYGVVYVLEKDADGYPVIWAYDDSTGVKAFVGTTGPLTEDEVSGEPLRIDAWLASDPDQIHLLHEGGVTRFVM